MEENSELRAHIHELRESVTQLQEAAQHNVLTRLFTVLVYVFVMYLVCQRVYTVLQRYEPMRVRAVELHLVAAVDVMMTYAERFVASFRGS